MASTSLATPKTFPVILHVYDYQVFNLKKLFRSPVGFDFYRVSLEVHGEEYQYLDYVDSRGREAGRLLIGNPSQYTTVNKGLKLVESMVIGRTNMSKNEINQGVKQQSVYPFYDHTYHNSHHFVECVLGFLGRRLTERVWRSGIRVPMRSVADILSLDFRLIEHCNRALMLNVAFNVDHGIQATFPVVLHVYKVRSRTMRRFLGFQLKSYRSSVEVHGVEYMFCEHDGVAGIMMMTARRMAHMKGLESTESIVMGRTERLNAAEVNEVVERVGSAGGYGVHSRNVYDYISKNCHHFSDDLCNALVGKGIPGWIKRAAFYERNYTGEVLTAREKRGRRNPQEWMDGSLFMNRNPPRDRWPVRVLNYMNHLNWNLPRVGWPVCM